MLRIFKSLLFIILTIFIFTSLNTAFALDNNDINWGSWQPDFSDEDDEVHDRIANFLNVKPDYDNQKISQIITEVSPLVEKYTDYKFKGKIKFKLINSRKLALVLKTELIKQLKFFMPDTPDAAIELYAEQYSKTSKNLLGKYGFLTKKVYFLPYQFQSILKRHKVDPNYYNDILKLVVAHEICHLMQDQVVNLGVEIFNVKNQEEMVAFNALLEGHAMFIMKKVGKELQLDKALSEFYKIFSLPDSGNSVLKLDALNKKILKQFQLVYLGGEKFIEYHHEKGGNEKIWSMFKKHPKNSQVISNPEMYDNNHDESRLKLKLCLDFLKQNYDSQSGWMNKNIEMPNSQVEHVYRNFDPEIKQKIMSNISQNRVFLAKKADGTLYNITILVLKKDLKGSKFIKYLEAFVKKSIKENKDENVKFSNFKKEKIRFIKADATSRVTMTVEYMNKIKKNVTAMRICREEILIEIIAMNHKTTDEETKKNVETIFELYEGLKTEKMVSAK